VPTSFVSVAVLMLRYETNDQLHSKPLMRAHLLRVGRRADAAV